MKGKPWIHRYDMPSLLNRFYSYTWCHRDAYSDYATTDNSKVTCKKCLAIGVSAK